MARPIVYQTNVFGESEEIKVRLPKGYRFRLPVGMSYCVWCEQLKPKEEFHPCKQSAHGIRVHCIECERAHYKEFRTEAQKVFMRKRNLRVKFDLSPEEYQEMFDAQGGVCKICSKPETKIIRGFLANLSVDHDHATGEIRGLLCSACNLGLGYFRDDPQSLSSAIDYLMGINA